ncbi:MAG: HEAT repeat domain-containing protein [Planctomycetes bacterium]|nr:HEAT repeat domain-containing protein [Planctomycetota bacterium]
MKRSLLCLGAFVAATSTAWAGGGDDGVKQVGPRGQYRGPIDEVVAAFSLSPSPGGGFGPGGPSEDAFEGYERWEFWWEIQKDVLLRSLDGSRRDFLDTRQSESGMAGTDVVDAAYVRERILPALKDILEKSTDRDLRAAALASLGRLGSPEAVELLAKAAAAGPLEERRQAILGLGQIDHPKATIALLGVFRDTHERVELRSQAALALSLYGKREIMRILAAEFEARATVEQLVGEQEQFVVAIATALGLGDSSSRSTSVPLLVRKISELARLEGRSRGARVAMLASLGKLGDPSALPTLVDALGDEDVEIARAAALSLGDTGAKDAVPALLAFLADDGADLQARGFSCISLGKLGTPAALEALRAHLSSRRSRTVPSFAALGLGLARDYASAPALREVLMRKSEDQLRGAFALALGMLRDQASTEPLLAILERGTCDEDLRGYAAVALGMIRPVGGFDRMLTFAQRDRSRLEGVHRGLTLALGLWGDVRAMPYLLSALREESRTSVRANAIQALGMLRSRSAIDSLCDVLVEAPSRKHPEERTYAAAALGALGQKSTVPLYAYAFHGVNYRLRSPLLEYLMQQI